MKTRHNKNLGDLGEEYAVNYLTRNGYKIVGRNVYIGGGEIDIIARKNGLLVFIEVKTRRNEKFQDLEDSIDRSKEESLVTSCEEYLAKNKIRDEYRIDLIGIIMKEEKIVKFRHLEGIL